MDPVGLLTLICCWHMLSLDGYCMLIYCDSWDMMGISSRDLHHWCRLLSKFCRLSLKAYGENKMTWEDKAHFSRSCVSCKDLARYLASLNKNEWWQRTWWQQMIFLDDFGFSVLNKSWYSMMQLGKTHHGTTCNFFPERHSENPLTLSLLPCKFDLSKLDTPTP